MPGTKRLSRSRFFAVTFTLPVYHHRGDAGRGVVERALAWLNRFRRVQVRYERRADIHLGFCLLACVLICIRRLGRPGVRST